MALSSSLTASNPNQAPTTARARPRATGHDCVICQDPIFKPEVRAPCGHFYDISCITDLFQAAARDESLYPPRCCRQIIPLPRVQPHLTQALLTEFELKGREFGTLKRVYCASPSCSRFLGPLYEGFFAKIFTCPSPTCITTTCGKCRARYEGRGHQCAADAETEQVLSLSRASGWSRCPGCAQMIELDTGCFHMTCRCRTEFCYLCRARWKSCRCPQWDENRLVAAAEQRVDAQLQAAPRARPANPTRTAPAAPRPASVNIRSAARHAEANARVVEWFAGLPERPRSTANPDANARASERFAGMPERPRSTASTVRESVVNIRPPTHRAEANNRVSERLTGIPERPKSTTNMVGGGNTIREHMIRETMERLRVDHDCQHTNWEYRRGGGRCESCSHDLPLYLFRCRGCQMLSCNRCRRNRL
ncbi:hypothetical protein K503DRAFT_183938 [Rhizopogon vinicolor AM-OR11-026]|uniref:RBR-type E3 ubiquitin transferase n=1 Tax=Rhizopogon vinicolor AM-OR11-026 TaxID=1314800 RepID=A0A1B7MZW6_9AGAM|nr:hypothetical protein K503DRAFT_183938 [Rhizopogon vinicolor AM-OR11-026]